MIRWFRVKQDDVGLKTPYKISFFSKAMFPAHKALYQFVNLFQNNLAIEHSTNKWSGVWSVPRQ